MADTFRIPVHRILLPQNVVAGVNFLVLASLTHHLRGTIQDPEPVLVRPTYLTGPDGNLWQLVDGRHRFLSAVVAGRPDVLAREEPVQSEVGSP